MSKIIDAEGYIIDPIVAERYQRIASRPVGYGRVAEAFLEFVLTMEQAGCWDYATGDVVNRPQLTIRRVRLSARA